MDFKKPFKQDYNLQTFTLSKLIVKNFPKESESVVRSVVACLYVLRNLMFMTPLESSAPTRCRHFTQTIRRLIKSLKNGKIVEQGRISPPEIWRGLEALVFVDVQLEICQHTILLETNPYVLIWDGRRFYTVRRWNRPRRKRTKIKLCKMQVYLSYNKIIYREWTIAKCFCRRPQRVCWCSYLPEIPVAINGKIIVLQHPDEEKRNLKTGPMLFHGMASGQCIIYYGKKFPSAKHEGLKDILEEKYTYVLYPGTQSQSITRMSDLHPKGAPYNLILIDGTWQQAKSMYFHSPFLHSLPQVL